MSIYKNLIHWLILAIIVVFFIFNLIDKFWALAGPSDPLQYVGPAVWTTTSFNDLWPLAGNPINWAWIDRVMVLLGLRLIAAISPKPEWIGPIYIAFINTSIVILCIIWSYRRAGFIASLLCGILLTSSYMILSYGTYVYADQTVAFYLLLAFICYFSRTTVCGINQRVFIAGFFSAFALFSKALGVAGIVFFLIQIMMSIWKPSNTNRSLKIITLDIMRYAAGVIAGSVLVILLFILFYGWESLESVIIGFFFQNWKLMTRGGAYGNPVTYFPHMVSMKNLPVFLSLFIMIGAYRHAEAKNPLLMAWVFLGMLFSIYAFTDRGGSPILNYMFTAFIFAALGISIYISSFVAFGNAALSEQGQITLGAVSVLLLILGMSLVKLPTTWSDAYNYVWLPRIIWESNYIYFIRPLYALSPIITLGLLALINVNRAKWSSVTFLIVLALFNYYCIMPDFYNNKDLGLIFTLLPVIAAILMLLVEVSRTKWSAIAFCLVFALWSPIFPGAMAFQKAHDDQVWSRAHYYIARALERVPADKFSIYVEGWKDVRWDRSITVFHNFYGSKFGRGTDGAMKTLHMQKVSQNLTLLDKREKIKNLKSGIILLTDNVDAVLKIFPAAREIDSFKDESGLQLQVIQIPD
jgi:hypothetical protein